MNQKLLIIFSIILILGVGTVVAEKNNIVIFESFSQSEKVITQDFLYQVSMGNIEGYSTIHKFGRNNGVGTSYEPIAISGIYNTPQISSATKLRVKAGNINDDITGTGARQILIQGLNETGHEVFEIINTSGTTAGASSINNYIRLYRSYVTASGTYSSSSAGSHSGDITIENIAGTQDWMTIDSVSFSRSQSEVSVYTVPKGKTAYILDYSLTSDSSKEFDYIFFKRESILDTTAPYEAMRIQFEGIGIIGEIQRSFPDPIKFEELTDIGFMTKIGVGTADISAEFNLLVVDN